MTSTVIDSGLAVLSGVDAGSTCIMEGIIIVLVLIGRCSDVILHLRRSSRLGRRRDGSKGLRRRYVIVRGKTKP
jgi:hypothetical protein